MTCTAIVPNYIIIVSINFAFVFLRQDNKNASQMKSFKIRFISQLTLFDYNRKYDNGNQNRRLKNLCTKDIS